MCCFSAYKLPLHSCCDCYLFYVSLFSAARDSVHISPYVKLYRQLQRWKAERSERKMWEIKENSLSLRFARIYVLKKTKIASLLLNRGVEIDLFSSHTIYYNLSRLVYVHCVCLYRIELRYFGLWGNVWHEYVSRHNDGNEVFVINKLSNWVNNMRERERVLVLHCVKDPD